MEPRMETNDELAALRAQLQETEDGAQAPEEEPESELDSDFDSFAGSDPLAPFFCLP